MAITYGIAANPSWGSGTIDVAPPAGEIWEIQGINTGSNANVAIWGDTQAANLTPAANNSLYSLFCLVGGVSRLRFSIITSPASMATHYKRFTFSDLPATSLALGPIAATTGTVDVRPPAGKVWVVKFIAATAAMSMYMTNGANTTSRPFATTQTTGAQVKFIFSNASWGRISNTAGTTQYATVTYAELDAAALPVQNAIVTGTSGTYTDFRPPAGQIWVVFGGTQNYYPTNVASGRAMGYTNGASPKLTFQIDNNSWVSMLNDGTYNGVSLAQIQ